MGQFVGNFNKKILLYFEILKDIGIQIVYYLEDNFLYANKFYKWLFYFRKLKRLRYLG